MGERRTCEQCGATFEPRREHARFCSAVCRIVWNREHTSGQLTGDTALSWSAGAMDDAIQRLGKATGIDLPEAVALVSECVWWVTLVDATMVLYHQAAYDSVSGRSRPGGAPRHRGNLYWAAVRPELDGLSRRPRRLHPARERPRRRRSPGSYVDMAVAACG